MVCVAWLDSLWNPSRKSAIYGNNRARDIGLLQISSNQSEFCRIRPEGLADPEDNAKCAYKLFKERGMGIFDSYRKNKPYCDAHEQGQVLDVKLSRPWKERNDIEYGQKTAQKLEKLPRGDMNNALSRDEAAAIFREVGFPETLIDWLVCMASIESQLYPGAVDRRSSFEASRLGLLQIKAVWATTCETDGTGLLDPRTNAMCAYKIFQEHNGKADFFEPMSPAFSKCAKYEQMQQ
jgi:hypothetical protein